MRAVDPVLYGHRAVGVRCPRVTFNFNEVVLNAARVRKAQPLLAEELVLFDVKAVAGESVIPVTNGSGGNREHQHLGLVRALLTHASRLAHWKRGHQR